MPAPSAAAVVRAILILSDSDDTGLDVELKALLEASDDINGTGFLYIDADRGGTDTPLDGDMSLSVSQVSRVGWTGTEIIINDNDNPQSLSLATYFNTGGSGSDLTLYAQTIDDGEEAVIVAGNIATVGANFLRLTPGAALAALLDNITTGDRYIFKFARAAAAAVISLAASALAAPSVPAPSASCCTLGDVVTAIQLGPVSLAASASVPAPSASARVTAFDESWQPWGNIGLSDVFAIQSLDSETTYEVRVRALPRDKAANSSAWAIGEGTTGIGRPNDPAGVVAGAAGDDTVVNANNEYPIRWTSSGNFFSRLQWQKEVDLYTTTGWQNVGEVDEWSLGAILSATSILDQNTAGGCDT